MNLEHLEQIKSEECWEMMKNSSRYARFTVSLIGWLENNAQVKLKANSDMDSVPETSHTNTVQRKRRIQNYLRDLMMVVLINGVISLTTLGFVWVLTALFSSFFTFL